MAQTLIEILREHRRQLQDQRDRMIATHTTALATVDAALNETQQAIAALNANPEVNATLRRIRKLGLLPVLTRDLTEGD